MKILPCGSARRIRGRMSSVPFLRSPLSSQTSSANANRTAVQGTHEDHQIHRNHKDQSETCLKKVKRKLCSREEEIIKQNTSDIAKVTRNYDNYYQREFNRVAPSNQNNLLQNTDFIESLNVANLQKNLSDHGSKKENQHANQVLSKWM